MWGAILMLTATCFNAHGLLAIRFFLGAAEAAIGPGLTVIVAMWYKRSEQPLRHGAWFMGNVVAGIFGGVLAYGVGHARSIEPWKVIKVIIMSHVHTNCSARPYFFSSERLPSHGLLAYIFSSQTSHPLPGFLA